MTLRLYAFLSSDHATRSEIISTYEVILANTDDPVIKEEVEELLGILRQESLRVMQ